MKKIVSSFVVSGITISLIKPKQNFSVEDNKKYLAKYLYKLLEMGCSK
ncbi:MAG: hypothetical protein IJS47_04875 [Clostridia bacterium]|nr:hypothetical protein [Clostridia bacterium]